MTDMMADVLWRVTLRNTQGRWFRAEHPGQRVTLAALARQGHLARRAWRGDGIDRNSAFEYARPVYVQRGTVK